MRERGFAVGSYDVRRHVSRLLRGAFQPAVYDTSVLSQASLRVQEHNRKPPGLRVPRVPVQIRRYAKVLRSVQKQVISLLDSKPRGQAHAPVYVV